ncbi:MAG: SEC-C domain-containing protein [Bryobacterales bacterium]|nr:SEC-C domain-containing protein [Bryobacterales bacterium]
MPEIGPSGSMSGEWKRDLRAPAPFLDSTPAPFPQAHRAAEQAPLCACSLEVGRNSPCPCGSGKRYKRCCGVNAPPILHAA